jgi:hypothetical protein
VFEDTRRIGTWGVRHNPEEGVPSLERSPQLRDAFEKLDARHARVDLRPSTLISKRLEMQRVDERVVQVEEHETHHREKHS